MMKMMKQAADMLTMELKLVRGPRRVGMPIRKAAR